MDLLTSLRRTIIPMVMGWLLSLPIGPYVDERAVETALVAILGAAYYAVMRLLEERGIRAASFLIGLGMTPTPAYHDTGVVAEVPAELREDAD
ncbi:MAG TPA: hypothetical protein VIG24_01940 [Acidimicrobiia bacterium]